MNETKQNFIDFAVALSPFLGGGGGGLPTDIDDETLADGQVLTYDETNDVWVNDNAITPTNNTSTTAEISRNTNIPTMNTLSYALNRTTGIGSADTNYSTSMMRGISAGTSDLTAGTSALTSGAVYLVYQ